MEYVVTGVKADTGYTLAAEEPVAQGLHRAFFLSLVLLRGLP